MMAAAIKFIPFSSVIQYLFHGLLDIGQRKTDKNVYLQHGVEQIEIDPRDRGQSRAVAAEHPFKQIHYEHTAQHIAALQKRMLQAVSLFYERFKSRFELAINSRVFKDPQTLTQEKEQTLDDLTLRLENAWNEKLTLWIHRFEMARQKLNALGPQAVLKRGYSITRKQDGTIITRVTQTAPGEMIYVQVQDGMIPTEVK